MTVPPDSPEDPRLGTTGAAPDWSPDPAAELIALRAENQRLRALVASAAAPAASGGASVEYLEAKGARRTRSWRWAAAVVVLIVAALLSPIAVAGVWLKAQVLDTDRYVATVAPLASNPGVQQAIATEVTNQIYARINIDQVVNESVNALVARGVPSQLTALAPTISNGIKSLISSQVLKLVQSDAFKSAWVAANTEAHTVLNKALTGDTGAITVQNNEVSLNLGTFIESIKPQLASAGVPFTDKIPAVNATFVIFKGENIGKAQVAASYLNTLGAWLPWIALALLAAGVLVAPNRRRGIIVAACSLLAGMALLAAALALGRTWYVSNLPVGILDATTAAEVYDTIVAQMRQAIQAVSVAAIIAIIAALLVGPSRPSRALRNGLRRGSDLIRRGLNRQDVPPSAVERFVGRYLHALEWAVVGIAFLLVVVPGRPTISYIIWVALIALVVVVVLELLAPPETRETAGAVETAPQVMDLRDSVGTPTESETPGEAVKGAGTPTHSA